MINRNNLWIIYHFVSSIIHATVIHFLFTLSIRSRHVPIIAIELIIILSKSFLILIEFAAFTADISYKFFLAIIATKMKRPVARYQSVWIISIRHSQLWNSI